MRKVICTGITFLVCAMFGLWKIWIGFTAAYLLFAHKNTDKSCLWEIPMGVLACSIISDIATDSLTDVIKILIPVSSVFIAFLFPARLPVFFVVAVGAIYLKNIYALSAMAGVLWCGAREIIIKRQIYLNYSNIKRKLLQGNNYGQRKNV